MGLDVEELRFTGAIHTIADKEMNASVSEDTDKLFVKALYKEYVASGKPKDQRQWIREKLQSAFVSVKDKPCWVSPNPMWPFFDGRPMVFIGELKVAETEVSKSKVSSGSVLYVFGARKEVPGPPVGWEMVYRVVQQKP